MSSYLIDSKIISKLLLIHTSKFQDGQPELVEGINIEKDRFRQAQPDNIIDLSLISSWNKVATHFLNRNFGMNEKLNSINSKLSCILEIANHFKNVHNIILEDWTTSPTF